MELARRIKRSVLMRVVDNERSDSKRLIITRKNEIDHKAEMGLIKRVVLVMVLS